MTIKEAQENIGRVVIYEPYANCKNEDREFGVITSANDLYVFVRYGTKLHSEATLPECLKF